MRPNGAQRLNPPAAPRDAGSTTSAAGRDRMVVCSKIPVGLSIALGCRGGHSVRPKIQFRSLVFFESSVIYSARPFGLEKY
jgi:hypothetical protein